MITELQLEKIFKTHSRRSFFLSDYEYFGTDDNENFYANFINKSIDETRSKRQEDAIELSIILRYYEEKYLNAISHIIKSRRTDWIKLLSLDWLFNFYKEVPRDKFIDLNHRIINKSNSEILKVQVIMNLILAKKRFKIEEEITLLSLLSKTSDHALYYRILNVLDNNPMRKSKKDIKLIMKIQLEINDKITGKQRTALKTRIEKL